MIRNPHRGCPVCGGTARDRAVAAPPQVHTRHRRGLPCIGCIQLSTSPSPAHKVLALDRWRALIPFSGSPRGSSCAPEQAGRGLPAPIRPSRRWGGPVRRPEGAYHKNGFPARRNSLLRVRAGSPEAGASFGWADLHAVPADRTDIYRWGRVAPDKMHLGSRPRMPQRPAAVPGEAAA